jgi:hypothetical protein
MRNTGFGGLGGLGGSVGGGGGAEGAAEGFGGSAILDAAMASALDSQTSKVTSKKRWNECACLRQLRLSKKLIDGPKEASY